MKIINVFDDKVTPKYELKKPSKEEWNKGAFELDEILNEIEEFESSDDDVAIEQYKITMGYSPRAKQWKKIIEVVKKQMLDEFKDDEYNEDRNYTITMGRSKFSFNNILHPVAVKELDRFFFV